VFYVQQTVNNNLCTAFELKNLCRSDQLFLLSVADPQTPSFVKILGLILNASWVIVIFVWKFQNFRYHGTKGWSDTNFSHTIKSADPENPLFGARILIIFHTQAELQPIFS